MSIETEMTLSAAIDILRSMVNGDLRDKDHLYARELVEEYDAKQETTDEISKAADLADELRAREGWDDDAEEAAVLKLDDLVHDIAANIASNSNNAGLEGQCEFILGNLGSEHGRQAIYEALR